MMTFGLIMPHISLPMLALWETLIGLALLTGKFQRAAIISLYFHVARTFSPLVLLPEQTWNTPLIAASLEGQYIFKNLITVGSALVINAVERNNARFTKFSVRRGRTTNSQTQSRRPTESGGLFELCCQRVAVWNADEI